MTKTLHLSAPTILEFFERVNIAEYGGQSGTIRDASYDPNTGVLTGTVVAGRERSSLFGHHSYAPWTAGEVREFPYLKGRGIWSIENGTVTIRRSFFG